MGKINTEWHKKNKMPKNPKLEGKIKWHEGHAKNCSCRDSLGLWAKLKKSNKL